MEKFKFKTSLSEEELKDKIKGVVYGTAIGDGLGLSTEFLYKEQAKIFYGNGPIKFGNSPGHEFWRDACRSGWFENDFTDDTDQMLVILQSLLENDGYLNPINFAHRLKEWCRIGFPELYNKLPNGIGFTVGSSVSHKAFLSNPLLSSYEVWNSKSRNLAANGALMRTGVIGIPYFWNEGKVVENSILGAKVTHADPRSVTSAVIACVVISRLLRGSAQTITEAEEDPKAKFTDIIQFGSTNDHSYVEKFRGNAIPTPKKINSPLHRTLLQHFRRLAARISGWELHPFYEAEFNIPQHLPIDVKRFDNPAPLRPNVKPIDEYETDPEMINLCREVVDKYKFLLEENPLCPKPSEEKPGNTLEEKVNEEVSKATVSTEAAWIDQLYAHCFPDSLSSLKLDERHKIGYTFKCLGAGLYLGTRKKPEDMTSPEFFENLITQLVLETGDADTNCAAAGAILGCRLGKSGLPKGWVEGLRHHDFLEKISNNLCEMVLTSMKEDEDK